MLRLISFLISCTVATSLSSPIVTRRTALLSSTWFPIASASAATTASPETLIDLLKDIPTFAIVDKQGVPYMVVGEDAKVTGYFFTSYEEAKRILQTADASADKLVRELKREQPNTDPKDLINPWKLATITTVPLDVAVSLTANTVAKTAKNYFKIAPSANDIEDALDLSGQADLEEGKVPLFYVEEFRSPNGQQPLYFSKSQLLNDYRGDGKVQVTELFATLKEILVGEDPDLLKLTLIPPADSIARAHKITQQFKQEKAPFVLGQRIIIL
ncbi:hypothetical protein FisN_16Lh302 [Fistulifera solaris]|uniref:Uncharacterized protein n=1 Tax=Fistulifera solaris TaxID=1519565 RepID=A0A1Z5KNT7_FISSO|nr:hypothetical protein FisN_16Lh302 [Fistulifera solaris]|eukprot:GAX28000.1 hypothetical protein FisN_16Lh302 [Fistulifera solaris]